MLTKPQFCRSFCQACVLHIRIAEKDIEIQLNGQVLTVSDTERRRK
jgi:hypothetical protein